VTEKAGEGKLQSTRGSKLGSGTPRGPLEGAKARAIIKYILYF